MLVIGRKRNQSVILFTAAGEQIRVFATSVRVEVDGTGEGEYVVTLGFEAPSSVEIVRAELCEREHERGKRVV